MQDPVDQDLDFVHHFDEDSGRVDSICRFCYQTIVSSRKPETLRMAELQHDCTEKQHARQPRSA